MHMMGSKVRQSKVITSVIREREGTGFKYFEPFCGAVSSAVGIIKNLNPSMVVLSDINKPMIKMWNGLVDDSLVLPSVTTEEEYTRYKKNMDMDDPLTAWFGYGLSYFGQWMNHLDRGGKGRRETYDFTGEVASTMRKVAVLKSCKELLIMCADYLEMLQHNPAGYVIYADPPYESRTKAHCFDSFDYPLFWDNMRKLSENNHVYVTGFDCPDDFGVMYNWGDTVSVPHNESTTEKLVMYRGEKS